MLPVAARGLCKGPNPPSPHAHPPPPNPTSRGGNRKGRPGRDGSLRTSTRSDASPPFHIQDPYYAHLVHRGLGSEAFGRKGLCVHQFSRGSDLHQTPPPHQSRDQWDAD